MTDYFESNVALPHRNIRSSNVGHPALRYFQQMNEKRLTKIKITEEEMILLRHCLPIRKFV